MVPLPSMVVWEASAAHSRGVLTGSQGHKQVFSYERSMILTCTDLQLDTLDIYIYVYIYIHSRRDLLQKLELLVFNQYRYS